MARKRSKSFMPALIGFSVVAHALGFWVISTKAKQVEKHQTLIAMVAEKKKAEEEQKKPPPKPVEAPKEVLQRKAPKRAPTPEPQAPPEPAVNQAPSQAMEALPNIGVASSSSGPGLAVPTGSTHGTGQGQGHKPKEKNLSTGPARSAQEDDLAADIAAWKPKLATRAMPVYPDSARSDELEGTVIVKIVIGCTGKVVSATIEKGVRKDLDESALTAAKKTVFEPAPRCAPGFQKPLRINYPFRLGD